MRYFLANYYKNATGKMDEVISMSRRMRTRDLQSSSVILDFQSRSVVKCSIGEQIGVRDFQIVRDYYHQHYSRVIEDLERMHEKSHTAD